MFREKIFDAEGFELEIYRRVWYVEIGYRNLENGTWDKIVESVRLPTLTECQELRDSWVESGRLNKVNWGDYTEYRPKDEYQRFSIHSGMEKL